MKYYDESCSSTMLIMRWWTVLLPTLLFSIMTDTLHILMTGLIAAVVTFVRKNPLKVTLRTGIYSAVICLSVIAILTSSIKIENRFALTPSELGVPAALICAMTLCFFGGRPSFSAAILLLSIFSLMMCGDINIGHDFSKLPLPASWGKLKSLHIMYVTFIVMLLPPYFYLANRSNNGIKVIGSKNLKMK